MNLFSGIVAIVTSDTSGISKQFSLKLIFLLLNVFCYQFIRLLHFLFI